MKLIGERWGFVVALTLAATPLAAQEPLDGNAEMAEIFAADQAARSGAITAEDWTEMAAADAARRARARELLDSGTLTTANDFYAAAFVFQHGEEPEDFLLAHALAVRALGLGHEQAEWIAAATLDRYLQTIAREQIYGTQYQSRPGRGTTQGRYNRELLPDQVRVGAGVPTLVEQEERRREMEERFSAAQ